MRIHWHRRDLRAADNRGLAAAAATGDGSDSDSDGDAGGVLPVFVLDDAVLDHADRREAAIAAFERARGEDD